MSFIVFYIIGCLEFFVFCKFLLLIILQHGICFYCLENLSTSQVVYYSLALGYHVLSELQNTLLVLPTHLATGQEGLQPCLWLLACERVTGKRCLGFEDSESLVVGRLFIKGHTWKLWAAGKMGVFRF